MDIQPQTNEQRVDSAPLLGLREKLEINRCQYGVLCRSAYQNGYEADCGEPATYKWTWNKGEPDESWIYVCDEHDAKIEESENEPGPESTP